MKSKSFTMNAAMSLNDFVMFKWKFRWKKYGTPLEQSEFIRDHLIYPCFCLLSDTTEHSLANKFSLSKNHAESYSKIMKTTDVGQQMDVDEEDDELEALFKDEEL
eukprot:UN24039